MKRSKSHQINDKARALFSSQIPSPWVVNEYLQADYGKDYQVEIFDDDGTPTEYLFQIQLKGKREPHLLSGGNAYSFSMKTNHLKYYLKAVTTPIFLVIADLKRQQCCYLFLQEVIVELFGDTPDFRNKKEISLRIPTANQIRDGGNLKHNVISATEYMRNRYPGTVASAVRNRERALEKIDNRFRYQVSYLNGAEHVSVDAKEEVDLAIKISGDPSVISKFHEETFTFGRPGALSGVDIEVAGSPLFADKVIGELNIEPNHLIRREAWLTFSKKKDAAVFPILTAELSSGVNGMFLKAFREKLPIIFEWRTRKNKEGTFSTSLTFNLDLSDWEGVRILNLPYFDVIVEFLNLIRNDEKIEIDLKIKKHDILESEAKNTVGVTADEDIKSLSRTMEILDMARIASKHFRTNPKMPKAFRPEDMQDISELYALATSGEYLFPDRYDFAFEVPAETKTRLPSQNERGKFLSTYPQIGYKFLGEEFALHGFSAEFSEYSAIEIQEIDNGSVRCKLIGALRKNAIAKIL